MLQTSITTRSGFTAFTNCAKPAGVVTLAWKRCRPVSPSYSQPTVLYFPKSNAKIFITGYSLLSQILSQPEKAKLVYGCDIVQRFDTSLAFAGCLKKIGRASCRKK